MRGLQRTTFRQLASKVKTCFSQKWAPIPSSLYSTSSSGILKSEFPDVDIPQDVSVPSFIWDQNVRDRPDKVAMVSKLKGIYIVATEFEVFFKQIYLILFFEHSSLEIYN